uniref:Centrosomal protein 85, like n=1 Tax=Amphilophus citrinellus TaxID=61819 RepID=A0A3Q0RP99_AMPCI
TTHLYSQPLWQHQLATSPLGTQSCLDTKDRQSIRRWSSLSKLSLGTDKCSASAAGYQYNPAAQGSLDRVLEYRYRKVRRVSDVDLYLPLPSPVMCSSFLQHSPCASPGYLYSAHSISTGLETDMTIFSPLSSPVKQKSLDINYSTLPDANLACGGGQACGLSSYCQADSPLGHQANRASPVQSEAHTQMWLTEQMEDRPKGKCGGELGQISDTGTEGCGGDELSPWQQRHQHEPGLKQVRGLLHQTFSMFLFYQMLKGTPLPVNILVKVNEGLLRKREQDIDRQKLQILQLHAQIRENEQRIHQVLKRQSGLFAQVLPSQQLCCDEELDKKLAVAELEVIHLSKVFKQITQKYTEDIRKLEERIKTRDRYISSLKKKFQRESNQNQENQQRIETLEKYLSDLPTLDEVHVQEVQQKSKELEKIASQLQKSLEKGCALMKDKDINMKMQAKREKELIASVHSLQQKVQQCLDDGVRLAMQDLKWLELENIQLLEKQDHIKPSRSHSHVASAPLQLLKHQREQIERLTSQLLQQTIDEGLLVPPLSHMEMPEVGQLLKELSLCLLDLQGLCSILAQRAQGKEPNLSLLLGMKFRLMAGNTDQALLTVLEGLNDPQQLARDPYSSTPHIIP